MPRVPPIKGVDDVLRGVRQAPGGLRETGGEAIRRSADVIPFNERRMQRIGEQARRRSETQGLQSAIPNADGFSKLMDTEQILGLTEVRESATTAVVDNDLMYRLSRRFDDPSDEDLAYVDEMVYDMQNPSRDGTISHIPEVPRLEGRWNPETLDIEVVVDPDQIIDSRVYKTLRSADPRTYDTSGFVFDLEWKGQAPWLFNEDWKHSGRVKFVDDEGTELATVRSDEVGFPFDDDIKARRDPESAAQWWSDNPVPVWNMSSKATTKYQAETPRETEEMLRVMYSPDNQDWWDAVEHNIGPLGRHVEDFVEENDINLTRAQWDALNRNDPEFINDFLSGVIDPRVKAEEVIENSGIPDLDRILSGRTGEIREAQRKATAAHSAEVESTVDDVTNHFNGVMDGIKEADPVRYQRMLDFVGDSPYTQGKLWPGSQHGEKPMLIFHSGKALDLEGMGHPGTEMGQFLVPRETGLHTGDLNMAASLGHEVVTSSASGLGARTRIGDTFKRQERFIENLRGTLSKEGFASYDSVAREVFGKWLNRMAEPVPGSGSFERPKLAEEIIKRLDVDLERFDLAGGSDDATIRRLADRYLGGDPDLGRARERLRDVTTTIRAHANLAWQSAGRATWPLVFRGKRPFRMRDISDNNPQSWAQEALNYPTFRDDPEWSARLQAIVDGDYLDEAGKVTNRHIEATKEFRAVLEDAGFDHIIYMNQNTQEGAGKPAIVFWDQSLAKPLYGSKGFDPNTDSWARAVLGGPLFALGQEEQGSK